MTPAQLRDRMIDALVPAGFAFSTVGRVFDCPLCGGKGDLYLTVYDKPAPYLFNLGCSCRCEPQAVADEMARRARSRHSGAI